MKIQHYALAMIVVMALLTSCNTGLNSSANATQPPGTVPIVVVTPITASATSIPPTVTPNIDVTLTGVPPTAEGGLPPAVEMVRMMHALQRGLDPTSIPVEGLEAVVWDSTCLGVAPAEAVCEPRSVAGYRFTLVEGAGRYVYHSDDTGSFSHLAEAPPVDVGAVLLTWEEHGDHCQRIQIGTGGVAFGECGLPMISSPYAVDTQSGDLGSLLQTYAPFNADTAAGHVIFNGSGTVAATPSEQRMIAEWARYTRDVAWGGRTGAAWGLVITWVSEPDCASVNIFITGVADATRCDVNYVTRDLGRTRLNPEQLEKLYEYLDTYQAFEWTGVAAGSSINVLFAGQGDQWPSPEQQVEVSDFVRALLFQLPDQGYQFPAP